MLLDFTGILFIWRGPAPFFFVAVPPEQSSALKAISSIATYGWGVIPVDARIGETRWYTSLFPKNGAYLVPIKDSVRKAEHLADGDEVAIQLEVRL